MAYDSRSSSVLTIELSTGARPGFWQSIENPGRIGARSVPLRSASAIMNRLGRFHRALACLAAAAWDKPRSACQKLHTLTAVSAFQGCHWRDQRLNSANENANPGSNVARGAGVGRDGPDGGRLGNDRVRV